MLQIGKSLHDRRVSPGDGVLAEAAPQEIRDQIMSRPDPFVRAAGVGSGEEFAEGNHAVADAHDTPLRSLFSPPVGLGVLWIDQLLPFQRSANVSAGPP